MATAPRAASLVMPELKRAQLNPRTNLAPPDTQLEFDDRRLDDLQGYDFEVPGDAGTPTVPASEADVPESPMTKQLREEHEEHKRRNQSQQKPAEPKQSKAKLLKRPSSGGNVVQAPVFVPPPPPPALKNPQAARAIESTIFCFAPINGKAEAVSKCSSEQARPRSHTPNTR